MVLVTSEILKNSVKYLSEDFQGMEIYFHKFKYLLIRTFLVLTSRPKQSLSCEAYARKTQAEDQGSSLCLVYSIGQGKTRQLKTPRIL